MVMVLKGQSSVELMMVIGIALAITSPFVFASQSAIIELDDASRFLVLDNSLESLEDVSRSLSESSYPARRQIEFQTPDKVTNVYNPDFGSSSAIVFEIDSKAGLTNRSVIFDFKFDVENLDNLSSQGYHDLNLEKARNQGQVNVSVVS